MIGGGPAGLSAATWLGRYQRSTVVVDAGEHRNRFSEAAHGLLGSDPISPHTLLAEARAGLAQYPHVRLVSGTVTGVERTPDGTFRAEIDGEQITVQRIVLATGVRDRIPELVGITEHYALDVHHCPACDGFTIRGQEIIVLGAGDGVPAFAAELLDWAVRVRIVTDSSHPAVDAVQRTALDEHGMEVVDGVAEALIGEPGALQGVRLADGTLVPGSAVFFSYAHDPSSSIAAQLGCELDHEGRVEVNGFQLSSVEGVYAAGDLTPGLQLVPIAIGKGTAAGVACATSLRGHSTAAPAPDPAPPTRRFATGGNS
ncbi:NAD(P)/FAD-dependent oxidoreductase [Brevibacterium daeguense]|uniref:NAD(P)/FAD-dependent oxidoreductase n=1 Tax=Brevibacterium daeguense TaxID=909936 RepID=A0ABP8EGV5_9MICO